MAQRQQEIFDKLTAGLDLSSRSTERKRRASPPVKVSNTNPKKQCRNQDQNLSLEQASLIRKSHGIKTSSAQHTPPPLQSFHEIDLEGLPEFVESKNFQQLTPIQMQAIPAIMQGRDIVGIAPTGSGKTLAFLIPILIRIKRSGSTGQIQSLVLSPTYELSAQTYHVFHQLYEKAQQSTAVSTKLMKKGHRHGKESQKIPDVLFSTPFSILKEIRKEKLSLAGLKILVLDEADRLLSMEKNHADISEERHYVSQVDGILAACQQRHNLVKCMFSATFPPQVSDLANNILIAPLYITIGTRNSVVESVDQKLMYTGGEQGKLLALRQIFSRGITPPVLVFVDTKERADSLMNEVRFEGWNLACLHSDVPTKQRDEVLARFESGVVWILIVTDLMSRGIDFQQVNVVINYDFPRSTMDYIHRIGRTGRAGKAGKGYTFFTDVDKGYLKPIANIIKQGGGDIPPWMTTLHKENWKQKQTYGQIGIDKQHN